MKKSLPLLLLCCILSLFLRAQTGGVWTQKNDVGWSTPNGPTNRRSAAGFNIGSKAYLGTGFDRRLRNDFWRYDTVTNTWSQLADFGGTPRQNATGFSIGSKGYIGLGDDSSRSSTGKFIYQNDFWEYDTAANTWTQKASFGGGRRVGVVGFSIGSKGYVGTGEDSVNYHNDFWVFDPVANSWTQKASFGGTTRIYACGFSIGGNGYIGTGMDTNVPFSEFKNDLWEYDTAADSWTQKANFGGVGRDMAAGFSTGSEGFIGMGNGGLGGGTFYSDFWAYSPITNAWTQKANFPDTRYSAVTFGFSNSGYIATGLSQNGGNMNDLWRYDTASNSWTQKANFGAGVRTGAVGFSIGGRGFVGFGEGSVLPYFDFWQYDTATGGWSQMASAPSPSPQIGASNGFSAGGKGYVMIGADSTGIFKLELWAYDTAANSWTRRADFPGVFRSGSIGFSIGDKGYFGTGFESGYLKDFWQYDPAADTWTAKTDFPGQPFYAGIGFSVRHKGYVGFGFPWDTSVFYEYNDSTDTWTQKSNFLSSGTRGGASGFSIGGEGYVGLGTDNGIFYNDFWKYDPDSNAWTQETNFPGNPRAGAVGFSIGSKGYMGTGGTIDFWQYSPNISGADSTDHDSTAKAPVDTTTAVVSLPFALSPNPAISRITIELSMTGDAAKASLLITDASGKRMIGQNLVLQPGLNSIHVPVDNFSPGMYFVILKSGTKRWQSKFMKQ
jgi:Secretion system C-terminal sorting domain/Galactose oxidase, central domain